MNDQTAIAELVRKAAQGDQGAFNSLYLRTRDRAYFVAHSITKNEQDALDILQEAYLKAWQSLDSLEQPELFGAWFRQITGNTAKNFIKKQKPWLFVPKNGEENDVLDWQPENDTGYIPDAAMDVVETRRLIMELVDALPEDQRLCVLLYYYDEMSVGDIAAALKVPVGTVKNRLFVARQKISKGV